MQKYIFEDYLEKSNSAETIEELFQVFLHAINNHGLDRAVFTLVTDHPDLSLSAGHGVIHNYPSDWMNYYNEQRLYQIDPVIVYGIQTAEAFRWNEISGHMPLTKRQQSCLDMGEEAGLKNGAAIMFHGPRNQLAGFGFATSEKNDAFDGNLDIIYAYGHHFYRRFKKLRMQEVSAADNIPLTKKELEILDWAAKGKTDAEIGLILNISHHTVDAHMRSVFRKMGVNSRILAVVKAISLGCVKCGGHEYS